MAPWAKGESARLYRVAGSRSRGPGTSGGVTVGRTDMAGTKGATKAASAAIKKATNGRGAVASTSGNASVDEGALHELLSALLAAKAGNFSVRLPERRSTLMGQIGAAFNDLAEMNAKSTKE